MNNKTIIIDLITQELRFNQLCFKLREIGMEPQEYTISLIDPVLQLLGLPIAQGSIPPTISDKLADHYLECICRVIEYPNLILSCELKPLAEACYFQLVAFLDSLNKTIKP